MHIRENDCTIGIIASPRQNQFNYYHQSRATPGTGARLADRGKYQLTGHTAVFIRIGHEHKIVRGLGPKGILDTIRGVFFGSLVKGKWQNDENLFNDKTSRITEISIPREIAEKFNDYFENVVKEKLNQYVLSPESGTQGNCVYSALTVLIDFIYEHQHLFEKTQWENLEKQLGRIISDTAKRGHCMQGHLVSNIEKWGSHFQFDGLLDDIKEYLKYEIKRLEDKKDKSAKLFVGKKILEEVIMFQSKHETYDEESIKKILSRVQIFAYHQRNRNEPTSRDSWDKIKINYNLNIKIAETSLHTLYFDYKKSGSSYFNVVKQNTTLKSTIKNLLRKKDSSLSLYLRNLGEEDKSKLIAALIANNFKELEKFLLPSLIGVEFSQLKEFLEIAKEKYPANPLNNTAKIIIQEILKGQNFSSLKNKKRILQDAFKLIPDDMIDVHRKSKIAYLIDKKAAKRIAHFSYSPSYAITSHNAIRHSYIRDNEFLAAMKQNPVESSQFIIISLDFLQAKLEEKPEVLDRLNKIRQFYLVGHYESAIEEIKWIANEYKESLTSTFSNVILEKSNNLVEPDVHKNHSRRFFENKLTQVYVDSTVGLESIDKISTFLIGKSVENRSQEQSAVLDISHRHDIHALKRYKEMVAKSTLLKTRDRVKKEGFIDTKRANKGEEGETIYSRNLGVMKSISPNFYDEITDNSLKNPLVDIHTIKKNSTGYSSSNQRVAFVSSVSGHVYFIVAMLEKYMAVYKDDAHLSKDINNFIKAFMLTYISRGYHSLLEMVDVFSDPQLKEIFKKYNVELDLSFSDQNDLLKKAMYETQEYSKTLALKSTLHAELMSKNLKKLHSTETKYELNISKSEQPDSLISKQARELREKIIGAMEKLNHYINDQSSNNKEKAQRIHDYLSTILGKFDSLKNDFNNKPEILAQLEQEYKKSAELNTRSKLAQGTTAILRFLNLKSKSRFENILTEMKSPEKIMPNDKDPNPDNDKEKLIQKNQPQKKEDEESEGSSEEADHQPPNHSSRR